MQCTDTTDSFHLPGQAGQAGQAGESVLDLTSLGGTAPLGTRPTAIIEAVREALERNPCGLQTASREDVVELEARLRDFLGLPGHAVLHATTGAEAVDLALQLARTATGRRDVAYLTGAYHGGTTSCLEVCGIEGWGTGPAANKLDLIGDPAQALESLKANADRFAAIIFEPVMSNRGFTSAPGSVVAAIGDIARASGMLVIHDEIGCGLGRTGDRRSGAPAVPDMIVIGKTLGAGIYPISALLAAEDIVKRGSGRGRTFSMSWTPPGCAAALAYLRLVETTDLVEGVKRRGARLLDSLSARLADHPWVSAVHGRGLGLGVQLHAPHATQRLSLARKIRERATLVEPTPSLPGLRIMPALTMPDDLVLRGLDAVVGTLKDAVAGSL